MKSKAIICLPVDVNAVKLTVGALTPGDVDNYGFQIQSANSAIYAPHDGLLTDNVDGGFVSVTAKGSKYGSLLFGFAVSPEFKGKKDAPVKKGAQIGATVAPDGLVTWSATVPRPTKENAKAMMAIHPLILAGALGGIEYTGMVGAADWVDDMKKGLQGLLNSIATHAIAFGAGWLVGKA